jgi:hypothetical protein
MSVWTAVTLSYLAVFGGMGVLAWRTVVRGRALARRVPDEEKRWI